MDEIFQPYTTQITTRGQGRPIKNVFFFRRFCEAGDAHEAFQIVLKSKVK